MCELGTTWPCGHMEHACRGARAAGSQEGQGGTASTASRGYLALRVPTQLGLWGIGGVGEEGGGTLSCSSMAWHSRHSRPPL